MNNEIKFNEILRDQRIIPASSNLAARIIAAAEVRPNTPLWRIVTQEIGQMLYVPRPAYALAFSLALGIFLGLQNEIEQISEIQEWFSFMDVSSNYIGEGWL